MGKWGRYCISAAICHGNGNQRRSVPVAEHMQYACDTTRRDTGSGPPPVVMFEFETHWQTVTQILFDSGIGAEEREAGGWYEPGSGAALC